MTDQHFLVTLEVRQDGFEDNFHSIQVGNSPHVAAITALYEFLRCDTSNNTPLDQTYGVTPEEFAQLDPNEWFECYARMGIEARVTSTLPIEPHEAAYLKRLGIK